jgi:flagellar biosynthesis protein FlhG
VRRLAALADLLLVVATGEPTSLTDAYAVLKLHRRDRPGAATAGAARLVVNQAADRAAGERTWRTLDQACARFLGAGVPLAGIIRRDPRVPEAIRRQVPLLTRHPGCPAAADIAALAKSLAE